MNEIQGELERRLQHLEEALQRQDNAIIELKALLTRAADALKNEHEARPLLPDKHPLGCSICNLIAELRKTAE